MTDLSSPESDAGPGELAALLEMFATEQEALTELVTQLLQAHQALIQIVEDQQSRLDELEAVVDAHDPAVMAEAVRATRAQAEQARRHAAAVM